MDVNNIEKKVWAYIKANNMLEDCCNAVVGVSGLIPFNIILYIL